MQDTLPLSTTISADNKATATEKTSETSVM